MHLASMFCFARFDRCQPKGNPELGTVIEAIRHPGAILCTFQVYPKTAQYQMCGQAYGA